MADLSHLLVTLSKSSSYPKYLPNTTQVTPLLYLTVTRYPELQALIQGKEEPSDLWNLLPEELLLRWFNFHLSLGKFKTISNFTTDLKDGTAYLQLLSQIAPTTTSSAEDSITKIVEISGKLKCDDLLLAEDIVQGTPRFNVLFIAQLFDKYTNLAVAMQLKAGNTPSTQFATPVKSANHTFEDIGTREERGKTSRYMTITTFQPSVSG